MTSNKKINISEPINQLRLYGYEDYFISFKKLYEKNKLPNTILLTGQKGIGKSTFIYHFINYLLSQYEKEKYSLENFIINDKAPPFILFCYLDKSILNFNVKTFGKFIISIFLFSFS